MFELIDSVEVFSLIFVFSALVCFLPSQDPFHMSMEHHTDWVNDIVLCCNGRFRKYMHIHI